MLTACNTRYCGKLPQQPTTATLGMRPCRGLGPGQGAHQAAPSNATRAQLSPRGCSLASAATSSGKDVVIVGGGWAGFGAAKHLTEQGYNVKLLEASPNPGGLSSGWRTKSGRTVEAGMKGFWYQYRNIFNLINDLNLPRWPLTDWKTSGFWSPNGLVTEAPVFNKLLQLPTLIGQFVHTSQLYWSLSLLDRASLLPVLLVLMEYNSSEETYKQYDQMSALEMFRRCGVSTKAYNEFVRPMLLALMFAPPEELSAAVTLDVLYFFAFAHQNDFDVCWAKGAIAEMIFTPMVERIRSRGGEVVGNRLVTGLASNPENGEIMEVTAVDRETGESVKYPVDAVVFAVGITGFQRLMQNTPALASAPDLRPIMNLKAVDVIATRMWFDRKVPTCYPANVLAGFEPQAGTTFFNLSELQDEYAAGSETVINFDIYNSSDLMPLSDEAIIERVLSHLRKCEPGFKSATLVDSIVLRFPKAVSHFSPGSYASRPLQSTSVPNIYIAGDWVKGVAHGANGLSQERAYVTGLVAANLVIEKLALGEKARIVDAEPDEVHVAVAKNMAKQARGVVERLGLTNVFL